MNAANEGVGYLLVSAGSAMKMPLAFAGLAGDRGDGDADV